MPLVSAIIPAYNCAPYIGAAVRSVLEQTHRDVQVIVVDDGSTDGTPEALAPFLERIELIRQPNGGVAAARNAGLRAARGELVAFLDADDWWFPARLSAQIAALARFPGAGLVFSDFAVVDAAGTEVRPRGVRWKYGVVRDPTTTPWSKVFRDATSVAWADPAGADHRAEAYHGRVSAWLFQGNLINTCTVLLRREAVDAVGEFDPSLDIEEDYDYWLRVAHRWPFVYVDEALVAFRQRPGQLTRTDQIERIARNALRVVDSARVRMKGQLAPQTVSSRLARLHGVLGVVCLRAGRSAEARRHLGESLRRRPGHPATLVFYLLSLLPAMVFRALERSVMKARGSRPRR